MIKDMYYMMEFIRLLIFIKIVIKNVIRMRMMMMMMMMMMIIIIMIIIIIIIIMMMVMMTMIMRMRLSSIIYEVIGGIQHFFFYEEILQAKNA